MAIVYGRWPWKEGQCLSCPPERVGGDIDQWIIQCTQCKQNICEISAVEGCEICGFPYCLDCLNNHAPCLRNAVLEDHPYLLCRFCDHLQETGNSEHCCEDCLKSECNSRWNCYSHIYTTNCGHGDRCEECASWRFDPEIWHFERLDLVVSNLASARPNSSFKFSKTKTDFSKLLNTEIPNISDSTSPPF